MLRKTVTIKNKLGLHTHACGRWVQLARCFMSDVWLVCNGKQVDGKSIQEVMGLMVRRGTSLEVITRGEDELEALKALEKLVKNRFKEIDEAHIDR